MRIAQAVSPLADPGMRPLVANVQRTIDVNQPIDKVVGYLRDFAHAEAWDPGTEKCEQLGNEPIGLGTRWHNRSTFMGRSTELTYELVADEPDHVRFEGSNKSASTSDDLSFVAVDPQTTRIVYRADIGLSGAGRLADPVIWLVMQQLARKTQQELKRTLASI